MKDFMDLTPGGVRIRKRKTPLAHGAGGGKSGGGGGNEASNTLRTYQVVRTLELLCEGPVQDISFPYLNKTPLKDSDGNDNFNGVTFDIRHGLPDQTPIAGMPEQVSETSVDIQVREAVPALFTITDPDTDACKVTVRIPSLWKLDGDGNMNPTDLTYRVQYRPSGSTSWVDIEGSPFVLINEKCTSNVYLDHRFPLTGTAPWEVRVTRTTADNTENSKLQNDLYLSSYSQILDQRFTYPHSALMMIRAEAEQFGNRIPTRAALVHGKIVDVPVNFDPATRTYTGLWNGLFKQAWTDCPAWCFRDMVKNQRYGMARYVRTDFLSDPLLLGISQYCAEMVADGRGGEEHRFSFNGVVNSKQEAYDVLNAMVSVFRGMIFWAAGTAKVVQDSPATPTFIATKSNVIGGKFTYRGADLKGQHNRVRVSYNNPDKFYERDYVTAEDPDHIIRFGLKPSEIVAFGCTSAGQAYRAGRWLMYTERMEGEVLSFVGGQSFNTAEPGHIVIVRDPSVIGAEFGGRMKSYNAAEGTVVFDRPITLEAGAGYTITFHDSTPQRALHDRTVIGTGQATDTYTFVGAPVEITENPYETVWAVRRNDSPDTQWRILTSREVGPTQYEITAIRHDPAKFAIIENGEDIPLAPPSILPTGPLPAPYGLFVDMSLENAPGAAGSAIANITFTEPPDPRIAGYEMQYRAGDAGSWLTYDARKNSNFEMRGFQQGAIYAFRVCSYDGLGLRSSYSDAATAEATTGLIEVPGPVPGPITPLTQGLQVVVGVPDFPGVESVEIYLANTFDVAQIWTAGSTETGVLQIPGLTGGATYHAWGRTRVWGTPLAFSPMMYLGSEVPRSVAIEDLTEDLIEIIDSAGIKTVNTLPAAGDYENQIVFNLQDNTLWRWDGSAWTKELYAGIAPASVDITKIAASLTTPMTWTGTLPTTRQASDVLFRTNDSKLYRWNGTAYVASVPTVDLIGTISNGQLADNAVSASKIADAAVTIAKFASGLRPVEILSALPGAPHVAGRQVFLTTDQKTYRNTGSGWTANVDATNISGQVQAAQIAAVEASKVTGQLTNAQIAEVDAAKLTGQVTATQIANGAVTIAKFASGLRPVEIVSVLPGTPHTEGRQVFLTTDKKTYRNTGTGWTASVASTDISGQVTAAQIAGVNASVIAGQVVASQIANGAVLADKLADNAVTTGKLADGSVLSGKLADFAVTNSKLGQLAVQAANLANNAVTSTKIEDGAITTPKVLAGAIVTDSLAANAVTVTKLAVRDTSNMVNGWGAGNLDGWNQGGGTISFAQDNTIGAASGWVLETSYRYVNTPSNTLVPVSAGEQYYAEVWCWRPAGTPSASERLMAYGMTTGGTGVWTALQATAVTETWTKLSGIYTVPSNVVLLGLQLDRGAAGGTTKWSKPVLRRAAGAELIVDGAIIAAKLAAGSVEAGKIAADAVTAGTIATGAVTAGTIAANAVTAITIAAGAVTAGKLSAGAVEAGNIAAGAVVAGNIAALAVQAGNIAADAVTAGTVSAGAINTREIAAGAIRASSMFLGDLTNLAGSSNVDDTTYWAQEAGTLAYVNSLGNPAWQSSFVLSVTGPAGQYGIARGQVFEVKPGSQLHVSVTARRNDGTSGGGFIQLATSATRTMTNPTTQGFASFTHTGIVAPLGTPTIPAGHTYAQLRLIKSNEGDATNVYFGNIVARLRYGGELIVDGAIISTKIATDAVTAGKIAANAVTADTIAANAITSAKIAAGAIVAGKLAAGAVEAGNIAAAAVVAGNIAALAVQAGNIAADAVTAGTVAAGAINTRELAAGSVAARNLLVGALENLFSGYDTADSTPLIPVAPYTGTWSNQGYNGQGSIQIGPRVGTNTYQYRMRTIRVNPGEQYYFAVRVARDSAWDGTDANSKIRIANQSNSQLGNIFYGAGLPHFSSDFALRELFLTIPNGTTSLRIELASDATAGLVLMSSMVMRLRNAGEMIVDGAITAMKVAANAITADAIAANAVTSGKIAANAVTAGTVAANAISSRELQANAVTASRLAVTNFSNLLADGDLVDPSYWATSGVGATFTLITSGDIPGAGIGYARIEGSDAPTNPRAIHSQNISVEPNSPYYAECLASMSGNSGVSSAQAYLTLYSMNSSGALSSTRTVSLGSVSTVAWAKISTEFVTADNEVVARYMLRRNAQASTTVLHARFTAPKLMRRNGGELIVDGAITANKIFAGAVTTDALAASSVVASKIAAGAVVADKISVNNLAAISANLGAITAGSLNINNNFIVTAQGQATIRSGTTGQRMVLTNNRLDVYDSNNVLRVRIGDLS